MLAFENYLRANQLVREKHIPYYGKWVADCYRFNDVELTKGLSPQMVSAFLRQIETRCEDWQVKQAAQAIKHYKLALHIKPDLVEANINLGNTLFMNGDIDGAIEHFRNALQINPNHISAKNNLEKLLLIKNQK